MTPANSSAKPTLAQIVAALALTPLTGQDGLEAVTPTAGYTSDLLSCVMANAPRQGIWITLQAHTNIVAVAALLDLSAVIITEGAMPDPATVQKALEEGVRLFASPSGSFDIVGRLWELGFRAE